VRAVFPFCCQCRLLLTAAASPTAAAAPSPCCFLPPPPPPPPPVFFPPPPPPFRDSLAEELLAERDDVAEARKKAQTAVEALQAASSTLDSVPSELAATIASTAASSSSRNPKGGSSRGVEGFGGAFGVENGSSGSRRPVFGAERHPSMHIAAQIASATSLNMVGPAAVAAVVGGNGAGSDGLPSILEVDVAVADAAAADGGPESVRAFQVEIEEH